MLTNKKALFLAMFLVFGVAYSLQIGTTKAFTFQKQWSYVFNYSEYDDTMSWICVNDFDGNYSNGDEIAVVVNGGRMVITNATLFWNNGTVIWSKIADAFPVQTYGLTCSIDVDDDGWLDLGIIDDDYNRKQMFELLSGKNGSRIFQINHTTDSGRALQKAEWIDVFKSNPGFELVTTETNYDVNANEPSNLTVYDETGHIIAYYELPTSFGYWFGIADFDNDGSYELYEQGEQGYIRIFSFTEPSTITQEYSYKAGGGINTGFGDSDLAIADFDGDGDLDIMGGMCSGENEVWFTNTTGIDSYTSTLIISGTCPAHYSVINYTSDPSLQFIIRDAEDSNPKWTKMYYANGTLIKRFDIVRNDVVVPITDMDGNGEIELTAYNRTDVFVYDKNGNVLGNIRYSELSTTHGTPFQGPHNVHLSDGSVGIAFFNFSGGPYYRSIVEFMLYKIIQTNISNATVWKKTKAHTGYTGNSINTQPSVNYNSTHYSVYDPEDITYIYENNSRTKIVPQNETYYIPMNFNFKPELQILTSDNIRDVENNILWSDIFDLVFISPKNISYIKKNIPLEYSILQGECSSSSFSINGESNVSINCQNSTISLSSLVYDKNHLELWLNSTSNFTAYFDIYFNVKQPFLNCSDENATVALTFVFYNEETFNNINASAEYTITKLDTGESYNNTINDVKNFSVCIFDNETFNVDMILQYEKENHGTRFYFLDNATIGTTANNIILYLLNDTIGTDINIKVQNSFGYPLSDVYVQFQRYYIGDNVYRTVAMIKTDDNGNGKVFLNVNDIWYKYVLTQEGEVLRIIGPSLITSTELTLSSSTGEILTWEDYYEGIAVSCNYDETSNFIICTVADPSGLSTEACLDVDTVNIMNLSDYDEVCDSGSSMTLMVNLSDAKSYNNTVIYTLYTQSPKRILEIDTIILGALTNFGLTGILITILIFSVVVCVGIWNPSLAIALGVLGIAISSVFGFINISSLALGSLILVAIILIYKVRS